MKPTIITNATILRLRDRIEEKYPELLERFERGAMLAMLRKIIDCGNLQFEVESSDRKKFYTVSYAKPKSCTCEDFVYNNPSHGFCKHLLAVSIYLQAVKEKEMSKDLVEVPV